MAQDTQSQSGLKKKPHKSVSVSGGPVTAAEAAATLNKVGGLFKSVLHVSTPTERATGSGLESRSDLIESLMRFYKAAEPAFIITPRPVFVDVPRLHADKPAVMPVLQSLISKGCIAGYGPLATGKTSTLTVSQFGDAVGVLGENRRVGKLGVDALDQSFDPAHQ